MRAVRVREDCTGVELVEVPAPEPGPDEVVVTVAAAGICGSDLHLLRLGGVGGRILGHELAGYAPDGRPVAINPLRTCGTCDYCVRGDEPLCAAALDGLVGVGVDGGMAEAVAVPERLLVALPSGLDVSDASLVEPTAVAVRGLGLVDLRPASRVVVIGAGTVGLCAVAVARAMGADVEVVARHDHQVAAAARLGAAPATLEPCDLVVDAAGTASSLADAAERCAPGGTVLVLATYWEPTELPGIPFSAKELRLQPSFVYGRTRGLADIELAAGIVATTPELARALITDRFPLEGAPEAFARAEARDAGVIKVVFEP